MKKQIPNFPDYFATKDGKIGSLHLGGRWLKAYKNRGGYLCVRLYRNKQAHERTVHRLILETFAGPCPEGLEACHGDGNSANNRIKNLRWDTHRANIQDSIRHGTRVDSRGEKSGMAKLTEKQVRKIKELLNEKAYQGIELAAFFGVTPSTISCIKTGKIWGHLS